eukprot:4444659-Prymnesium_polylepis.1
MAPVCAAAPSYWRPTTWQRREPLRSKGVSKAPDMQELIRRLHVVHLCENLRLTHTPGVKLIRPDQTSRGDSVEEP